MCDAAALSIRRGDSEVINEVKVNRNQQLHQRQPEQQRQIIQRILTTLKVESSNPKQSLQLVRRIHRDAIDNGAESNIYIASKLVEMYANCESMVEAKSVFDEIQQPDVVLWNVLLLGYANNDQASVALQLFFQTMADRGCNPNCRTIVAALKACTICAESERGIVKADSLRSGKWIHEFAVANRWEKNSYVGNALIDMYARCGSFSDAKAVFDKMIFRDVVSWNTLITANNERADFEEALRLLQLMISEGRCEPNARTFVAGLKACDLELLNNLSNSDVAGTLEKVMALHSLAVKHNCKSNLFVANTLMDLYSKCGRMGYAVDVFDSLEMPDVVSWNVIVSGFAENGNGETAARFFSTMQTEGTCAADARSWVSVLKACSALAEKESYTEVDGKMRKVVALERGMALHSQLASDSNCRRETFVCCSLIDMYSKCGSMFDGGRVFDKYVGSQQNLVCWNSLIFGYAVNGEPGLALRLFEELMGFRRLSVDSRTFVAALKACTVLAGSDEEQGLGDVDVSSRLKLVSLERGMAIHRLSMNKGCEFDVFVSSSLVDMYSKCGDMEDARRVFDHMPSHGIVSCNSLLLGYAVNGEADSALELFANFPHSPDCRTMVAVLKACGNLSALNAGKVIHIEICRSGVCSEGVIATGLLDFYGKCGSMIDAQQVFDSSFTARDTVSWTALIAGYSRLGDTILTIDLFEEMLEEGVKPDGITFLSILTACCEAGNVDKGRKYFEIMVVRYGIQPRIEHYHCMVDMFGRANRLKEAVAIVNNMPLKPNPVTWTSVLAACSKWKDEEVAKVAFGSLLALDDKLGAAYVLMAETFKP